MKERPESEAELLNAATKLLCQEAVDAIAKLFRPEALAAASSDGGGRRVSRPTAYRLWGDRGQAVVKVAKHLIEDTRNCADYHLEQAKKAYVADADLDTDLDKLDDFFHSVLRSNFEWQFDSAGIATGWLLQAAALTSSPIWGGKRPDRETGALGQQILSARGDLYAHVTRSWGVLLEDAMAAYGRRPRRGVTVETITKLMHSMFNGLVWRTFIDPSLNATEIDDKTRDERFRDATELAADAMFQLAWSYTVPISLKDPRRPDNEHAASAFENVISVGSDMYKETKMTSYSHKAVTSDPLVQLDAVARRAGLPTESIAILFGDACDLADSVLRHLVALPDESLSGHIVNRPYWTLKHLLERLNRASTTHPSLIMATSVYPPRNPRGTSSFFDDLIDLVADMLMMLPVKDPQPCDTARSLVELARRRKTGWKGVEIALSLLDVPETDEKEGSWVAEQPSGQT